jgi:hypothetical protein
MILLSGKEEMVVSLGKGVTFLAPKKLPTANATKAITMTIKPLTK